MVYALLSLSGVLLLLVFLVRYCKRPVAGFHCIITNPVAAKLVTYLPGFGIIENVGRKSGRVYRTPVNIFRQADGFLIALTYGRESGWVVNVVEAGGCVLRTRAGSYLLVAPTVVRDLSRRRFPPLVRVVLGLIDANDYLQLQFKENC